MNSVSNFDYSSILYVTPLYFDSVYSLDLFSVILDILTLVDHPVSRIRPSSSTILNCLPCPLPSGQYHTSSHLPLHSHPTNVRRLVLSDLFHLRRQLFGSSDRKQGGSSPHSLGSRQNKNLPSVTHLPLTYTPLECPFRSTILKEILNKSLSFNSLLRTYYQIKIDLTKVECPPMFYSTHLVFLSFYWSVGLYRSLCHGT